MKNKSIIRFLNEERQRNVISYVYKNSNGNEILHLEFFSENDIPSEEDIKSGVLIYNADNNLVQGDFSNFVTIYNHDSENIYELSIDEVYIPKETIEETISYSDEELALIEKKRQKNEITLKISNLKNTLASTDYKIIKSYEYTLVGEEIEYDINELHLEREQLRDEINNLELELVSLN